jgi:TRAP-type C4-dicarboxylate transport system substrate-binding protein
MSNDTIQTGVRELASFRSGWRRAAIGALAGTAAWTLCVGAAWSETWQLGTPVPKKNIMATFIFQVQKGVKEKTGGKMLIRYKHDFNEQRIVDQMMRGRVQMAYVSATGVGVAVPEAAVLNVPYLWKSAKERDYVTDKYVTPELTKIFAAKGLTLVRFGEAGWTSLYCKTAACTDPSVFKGMKVRVSPNPASRMFWSSLGTNGVTLPLTETWPALQTGVVNAGDLTFGFYLVTPAAKIAPHYVFTRHLHQPAFFLANKKQWDALPAARRKAILSSAPSTSHMRKAIVDYETPREKDFLKKGGKTHHLTEAQLEKFRALVVPKQNALVAQYGGRAKELYDIIQKGKQEFAGKHMKKQ